MKTLSGILTIFITVMIFSLPLYAAEPAVSQGEPAIQQEQAALIMPAELKALIDKAEPVVIVDVRSAQEFYGMHIAGSVSVPLANINSLVDALPREMSIVFY
jgi:3-mercaptopyruvate sulfurtransferase SseA